MSRKYGMMFLIVSVAAIAAVGGTFFALSGDTTDALPVGEPMIPEASSQEANRLSDDSPTIQVTGSAKMILDPDQATVRIVMRSQPMAIEDAMAQYELEKESLVDAITEAAGGSDDSAEIVPGSLRLRQHYVGQESYSNIDTFTIRSTVSIETDIEEFSKVVSRLTDEDYTFESVYAGPMFQSSFARADASMVMMDAMAGTAEGGPEAGAGGEDSDDESGQITLNVAISTKHGPIDEVVGAYEEKHQKLLRILVEEMGIPPDTIQPASVNINPLYRGPVNQDLLYTYSLEILVKTSPENVPVIMSAVDTHDAFVDHVRLVVSDEQLAEVEGKINLAAFDNAKSKAEEIAQMAGFEVGGVQNIEIITWPVDTRSAFYGNLYNTEPQWYTDAWEIGASVTAEFELTK